MCICRVNSSNAAGIAPGSESTAQANTISTASTPNATAGPSQALGSQNKLSLQGSNSQQKSQEGSQMGPGLGTAAQRQSEAGVQEQAGTFSPCLLRLKGQGKENCFAV